MKKKLVFTVLAVLTTLAWDIRVASAEAEIPTGNSTTSDQSVLAEVTVTAQKRSQRLSDVGITFNTANAEQLQSAGVTDVGELTKVVPGFSVGQSYSGYPVFSMRGVNFNAAQFSAAPAVSTYIDEAVLPYPPMAGAPVATQNASPLVGSKCLT